MFIHTEHIIQIIAAFVVGGLLGLEREYHSKPAGFRTMILICVGSCLFTILSTTFAENPDRIASNILTGIGFIGAGVVFKEGINISGITSAATIWIAASLGMCIGLKFYGLALFVAVLVMIVLIVLSRLEESFDNLHQVKQYKIRFKAYEYSVEELENELKKIDVYFVRYKVGKQNDEVLAEYKIEAIQSKREKVNRYLINNKSIVGFDV
ncbi:putative Mg(2+) transport ATPase [mine drainage metagenome]|uniref:Putative Mg(2+) transport ATPase n=1 Tax=mine drainage metagenome TaxID=410659 RepID=A0A1J5TCW6_9ZZZZ